MRLFLHCFSWQVLSARKTHSSSTKNWQKHSIKMCTQFWDMIKTNCPRAWNLPRRFNPWLLQPTLSGGATSTTPSPLTKSIGIFLLVDYEEAKKRLHLQRSSIQNTSAKHVTKFNPNKTPEASSNTSKVKHATSCSAEDIKINKHLDVLCAFITICLKHLLDLSPKGAVINTLFWLHDNLA